ncbi:LOW QUALITY PROTEIN: hypothetical protein JCM24511_08447 [Saitozyma sp. JCM 24511]|nr:LOW QUALITY PROTEIN: hypothetical protein JCM24511_08447 [Saitozyma sp. JCM 24511]
MNFGLAPALKRLAGPASGGDEVGEGLLGLLPATGLETAVGVDDEEVGGEDLDHGGDTVLDLLLSRDTGRVDVVDTGADLVRVAVRLEDVEKLEVGLGGLDRDDVGVETLDGGEDVSEVRVAEVRVDLDVVLDARGGEAERVDGPTEVVVPVGLAEGETLTDGRLVDLDGLDAGVGKVDDLVAEGEGELLGLDLLGDVGTGERPVEDGDRAGRPADGHGGGAGDVRNDDRGADVTRAVRLNPTELGEDEAVELLAKVLDHVVTLGLAVDEEVEADLLLELARVPDLGLHGLLVLLLGDLTLAELGAGETDLLGLGEGSDGGGGELGEVEVLLLGGTTLGEGSLAGELLLGDAGDTVADGRVRGALKLATGGNVLGVLLEEGRLLAVEGGGEGGDLLALLLSEREPALLLLGELGLDLEGDGGVEERGRGGDDDAVGAELGDGLLGEGLGGLEVVLPDVSARDDTELDAGLGGLEGGEDLVELLGLTVEVEVEGVDGEVLEELDRLADTAVGGGDGDLGGDGGEGLVDLLEEVAVGLGLVEDEDGLVDLDLLRAGLLERLENLLVDGDQRVEELERLKLGGRVTRLADEGEVGDGTEEDGAGLDAESLGLLVLGEPLVVVELESGLGLVVDLDDVVVGVEADLVNGSPVINSN